MVVTLDGEVVVDVQPVIGYLHRGVEKLAEGRSYTQNIPLTDRLDYLSSMTNNYAYVLAVEKLLGIEVAERGQYIRIIVSELQRIANHLAALAFFMNDIGAYFTPLIYMFRERDRILDLFQAICGQRLNYNYMRFGGVSHDFPPEFYPGVAELIRNLPGFISEYEGLINENEILLGRTKGVGVVTAAQAINGSLTGPVLRASGVKYDLRKADPYGIYDTFDFDLPVGQNGDVYDRVVLRLYEMRQSLRIVQQAMERLPHGDICTRMPFFVRPAPGEAYARIESPKGELGYYVVSDSTIAPYRYHVRPPSLINLSLLREMSIGTKIADLIVILGSIDIVMGEVDR
jgi:NADH-quinone oxidoreductase subunit D